MLQENLSETMNPDANEKPTRLKWPKYALAAVILFFALAVFWMSLAVNKLRHQREVNAPLPVSAPVR